MDNKWKLTGNSWRELCGTFFHGMWRKLRRILIATNSRLNFAWSTRRQASGMREDESNVFPLLL